MSSKNRFLRCRGIYRRGVILVTFGLALSGLFATDAVARPPLPSPTSLASPRSHRRPALSKHDARVRATIIGGTAAAAGTLPWMAFVVYSDGASSFVCSGTVISPNVVMTAGHCVDDETTGVANAPGGYAVVTGSVDWTDASTRQVSAVSRTISYPAFNLSTLDGDVGLLVLSTPTTAPAIRLATSADTALIQQGTAAAIAGWGLTAANGQPPDWLQWSITAVQSSTYCQQFAGGYDASKLCAIDPPSFSTGTCQGDSGGPLVAVDSANKLVEIGLTSSGPVGCATTLPDVFTRVDPLSSWAAGWIAAVAPAPPPPPSSAPAPPVPTVSPPPASPAALSGAYRGSTRQGRAIRLRVATNRHSITALNFSYRLACQLHHHHFSFEFAPVQSWSSPWAINKSRSLGFSDHSVDSSGTRYEVSGTFNAAGYASGTLQATWRTRRYGICKSGTVRWQARRKSA